MPSQTKKRQAVQLQGQLQKKLRLNIPEPRQVPTALAPATPATARGLPIGKDRGVRGMTWHQKFLYSQFEAAITEGLDRMVIDDEYSADRFEIDQDWFDNEGKVEIDVRRKQEQELCYLREEVKKLTILNAGLHGEVGKLTHFLKMCGSVLQGLLHTKMRETEKRRRQTLEKERADLRGEVEKLKKELLETRDERLRFADIAKKVVEASNEENHELRKRVRELEKRATIAERQRDFEIFQKNVFHVPRERLTETEAEKKKLEQKLGLMEKKEKSQPPPPPPKIHSQVVAQTKATKPIQAPTTTAYVKPRVITKKVVIHGIPTHWDLDRLAQSLHGRMGKVSGIRWLLSETERSWKRASSVVASFHDEVGIDEGGDSWNIGRRQCTVEPYYPRGTSGRTGGASSQADW